MKHIVRKPFWNYEKEEQWLNEKAASGLAFTDYSLCRYVFEDSSKDEYVYRIVLLDHSTKHPTSKKYIAFLEETGIEMVATYMRWLYLRKKTNDEPFVLYSDIDSKIKHYQKVSALWLIFAGIEFGAALINIVIGIVGGSIAIINLVLGCIVLALGFMFLVFGLPIRQKMRRLKKEQTIRES